MLIQTAKKIKGFETLVYKDCGYSIQITIYTNHGAYQNNFDPNTSDLEIKDWIESTVEASHKTPKYVLVKTVAGTEPYIDSNGDPNIKDVIIYEVKLHEEYNEHYDVLIAGSDDKDELYMKMNQYEEINNRMDIPF